MAANQILLFAPTDTGTNLLTQTQYAAASDRTNGVQPGVASSKLNNKAMKQASLVAAAVAQYIADSQAADVTDALSVATLAGMLAAATGARYVKRQVFTASGTYTPSSGMVFADIEAVGGGGAGGGSLGYASADRSSGGTGGGAGGYGRKLVTAAQIGASKAIAIGAGGTGGVGTNGNSGGATTVAGLVTANGGGGGLVGSGITTAGASAGTSIGGSAAGCDVNVVGQAGQVGFGFGAGGGLGGAGGSGPFGAGALQAFVTGAGGNSGFGFGAGGGGSSSTITTFAGGAGTAGFILITEYCTQP